MSKVNGATRLVYEWLQDDEGAYAHVCKLKGEAQVDVPEAPAKYLADNIREYVGEAYGQLGEDTLVTKLFGWAFGEVQWAEMAWWVLRNPDRWPATDPGPLEETP